MKLKIDNSSVTRLFGIVSSISEVRLAIDKQEVELASREKEIQVLRTEVAAVAAEVDRRANMLRDGNIEGLKELLHLQWLQEEAAKKVSYAETCKAGISTALSLLDDELVSLQKQIDATLEGRKV